MIISYQEVTHWFKTNFKVLVIIEVLCLLFAGGYFLLAPRIYETQFSIGLPKVPVVSNQPNGPNMRLMISPQEFIRPTQDPMAYSEEFVKNCMGQDTNANRKKMINALQLGVQKQGDVIAFTLRLEGTERSAACANLFLTKVLEDLSIAQVNYLKTPLATSAAQAHPENIVKPALIQAVRMSDSYIKPDFIKIFTAAILAGAFLTVLLSVMRKRYRA
jgi:hypothetical protein